MSKQVEEGNEEYQGHEVVRMFDYNNMYHVGLVDTSVAPRLVCDDAKNGEFVEVRTVRYYSDSQTEELDVNQLRIFKYTNSPSLNVKNRS